MEISESIAMALLSIRANKLRAGLTLLSIAIGVFAIVGVAAAVAALNAKVDDQLASLGRNTFFIQKMPAMNFGHTSSKYWNRKDITLRQAEDFKRRLTLAESVSLVNQNMGGVVRYEEVKTDPDVMIFGGDESFITNYDYSISEGRSLDARDVAEGSDVAVVGADLANEIFPNQHPVGKSITVNNHRYLVVGLLNPKGATFGQSQDNLVLIPISSSAKYFFDEWGTSISIMARARSTAMLQETVDQAIGIMRLIRHVEVGEENDFEVMTNESLSETLGQFTGYISWFGLACGVIALIAAGVGIMNIMLVSVKERTREIGIRKAIGASKSNILAQFLIEALTLTQVGALIGIALGLLGGIGIGALVGAAPAIPWSWVLGAVGACLLIGLLSGIYPAWKASRLDPIEALRYE
jgi:putative ABC transport system permease protein